MEIKDINSSGSKEEDLLGILSELDNIGCSEKTAKAIAITKDLIKVHDFDGHPPTFDIDCLKDCGKH